MVSLLSRLPLLPCLLLCLQSMGDQVISAQTLGLKWVASEEKPKEEEGLKVKTVSACEKLEEAIKDAVSGERSMEGWSEGGLLNTLTNLLSPGTSPKNENTDGGAKEGQDKGSFAKDGLNQIELRMLPDQLKQFVTELKLNGEDELSEKTCLEYIHPVIRPTYADYASSPPAHTSTLYQPLCTSTPYQPGEYQDILLQACQARGLLQASWYAASLFQCPPYHDLLFASTSAFSALSK